MLLRILQMLMSALPSSQLERLDCQHQPVMNQKLSHVLSTDQIRIGILLPRQPKRPTRCPDN